MEASELQARAERVLLLLAGLFLASLPMLEILGIGRLIAMSPCRVVQLRESPHGA